MALKFNSHKSVQKLFHNLHIIFSNSLMVFKVNLRKNPNEGNCLCSRNIFFNCFFGDRLTIEVSRTSIFIILCYYIRIVRQMTGLLLSNLYKNIVKNSIWKFIDIFPNQILNFLNIFTEHGKIIADYTKSIERMLQLLCRNVFVERL